MTKLQKTNDFTGMLEDVYPNLIIVGGKNIAVPVDKQHLVKNMDAKVGDIIRITYDERGYLLSAELKEKGKVKVITEQDKKVIEEAMEKHKEALTQVAGSPEKKPEPVKEYVSLRERLIVHQTTYKECCATVRELILCPNESLDEDEFNRITDLALKRAKADAKALLEAVGESK